MNKYKGIILAGGSGTRLHPVTQGVSKQLLPIYNKPMIYYPLSVQMMAGIQEILIITTPFDLPAFQNLLGDGSQFGIKLSYAEQPFPEGLAQAFLIGESFIGDSNICLILGDNIFYGPNLEEQLLQAQSHQSGATIFGYHVPDPHRFGVAEFCNGKVVSIEEKPINPKSDIAVTGLYFYDNKVINIAKQLQPSMRNELEITDIHMRYLEQEKLHIKLLDSSFTWLDTGTYDSLLEAGQFVKSLENTKNVQLGCLEEIAFKKAWISEDEIKDIAKFYQKTSYGTYLTSLIE